MTHIATRAAAALLAVLGLGLCASCVRIMEIIGVGQRTDAGSSTERTGLDQRGDHLWPGDRGQRSEGERVDGGYVCTPECTGTYICCTKLGASTCQEFSAGCACDPATGKPCANNYPYCCTSAGVSMCKDTTAGCACDPTTGKPCMDIYPICCDKGMGPACYQNSTGCL